VVFSRVAIALKTTIYIDGYNLYYSRLRGTSFKWLDVVALFRDVILAVQDPSAEVVAVKFFTAPIKATYARHGAESESAQKRYHRALKLRHPELVEVIQGFHILGPSSLPRYVPGQLPSKADLHQVWMIEEKQTDVNLALHIYRDATRSQCEQLVICSNDSDLEPALQMVRSDAPGIAIGLVMPLRDTAKEQGVYSNKRLTALADWVRHHIRDEELGAAQLPTHVPSRKKPVSKPSHW
jgi:uncharacterized LabA/DUF88 family protein